MRPLQVLLTATVTPNVSTRLSIVEADIRCEQYATSLRMWSAAADRFGLHVIFAENSGFDLDKMAALAFAGEKSKVSYVSCNPPELSTAYRGKGAAEAKLIGDALASGLLDADLMIYKCTGRLFVRNLKASVAKVQAARDVIAVDLPRTHSTWVDTRFIGASFDVWLANASGWSAQTDDSSGRDLESVVANSIRSWQADSASGPRVLNLREQPHYVGRSGTSGGSYKVDSPFGSAVRRKVGHLRRALASKPSYSDNV